MQTLPHHIRWTVPTEILFGSLPIFVKSPCRKPTRGLLGMDIDKDKGRVWGNERARQIDTGASDGLRDFRWRNSSRTFYMSPVRQPVVRKSDALVLRNECGQRGGYGSERTCCMEEQEKAARACREEHQEQAPRMEAIERANSGIHNGSGRKNERPGVARFCLLENARGREPKLWQENVRGAEGKTEISLEEGWANEREKAHGGDKAKDEGCSEATRRQKNRITVCIWGVDWLNTNSA